MKIRIIRRWQEEMLRSLVEEAESEQEGLPGFAMGVRVAAGALALRIDGSAPQPKLRRKLGRW